jgi:hypothetical protein
MGVADYDSATVHRPSAWHCRILAGIKPDMRTLVLAFFLMSLVLMGAGHPLIGIGVFFLSAIGEMLLPPRDKANDA